MLEFSTVKVPLKNDLSVYLTSTVEHRVKHSYCDLRYSEVFIVSSLFHFYGYINHYSYRSSPLDFTITVFYSKQS